MLKGSDTRSPVSCTFPREGSSNNDLLSRLHAFALDPSSEFPNPYVDRSKLKSDVDYKESFIASTSFGSFSPEDDLFASSLSTAATFDAAASAAGLVTNDLFGQDGILSHAMMLSPGQDPAPLSASLHEGNFFDDIITQSPVPSHHTNPGSRRHTISLPVNPLESPNSTTSLPDNQLTPLHSTYVPHEVLQSTSFSHMNFNTIAQPQFSPFLSNPGSALASLPTSHGDAVKNTFDSLGLSSSNFNHDPFLPSSLPMSTAADLITQSSAPIDVDSLSTAHELSALFFDSPSNIHLPMGTDHFSFDPTQSQQLPKLHIGSLGSDRSLSGAITAPPVTNDEASRSRVHFSSPQLPRAHLPITTSSPNPSISSFGTAGGGVMRKQSISKSRLSRAKASALKPLNTQVSSTGEKSLASPAVDQPQPHRRPNVKTACVHCQKASKRCDEARPCGRCVRTGRTDCYDVPRKKDLKRMKRVEGTETAMKETSEYDTEDEPLSAVTAHTDHLLTPTLPLNFSQISLASTISTRSLPLTHNVKFP